MQLFGADSSADATILLKIFFFAHENMKKPKLKSCSEWIFGFFPLLPWAAHMDEN